MMSKISTENSVVVGVLSVIGVGVISIATWMNWDKLFFNIRRNEDGTVVTAGTVDQPNTDSEKESHQIKYQVDKDEDDCETNIEKNVTVHNPGMVGDLFKQRGNFNSDIKRKGELKKSKFNLKQNVQIGASKEEEK
ncbi:CLUMA_CG015816, isoform A [Clunio marinus]|uniref:CLUMA_CG015816, isoform A n=1 Tax=Clunio marinus TaxID=568069 RepID=A0A1J1IWI8_9DIPT|nr:CLUMA_CG015816, isoform A [Clunio marinus]